jgi:hypothetical protein
MKYGIEKPSPELLLVEELVALTKHIYLRIFIKHSCRHKLIKDTNTKRRQECKDNIETRHGPRFI